MGNGNIPTISAVFAMVFMIGGLIFIGIGNSLTGEVQNIFVATGVICTVLGVILFVLIFVYLFLESSGGSKL